MLTKEKRKLVVAHDFNFAKYFPVGAALPYEATGKKLCDEIRRRQPADLELVWTPDSHEMETHLRDADVLVGYYVARKWLDNAPRLKWIQAGSAGIDHFLKMSDVALPDISARGIALTSAAGVTRIVIGEHILAFILMFARGMHRAMRQQLNRHWDIFMADEAYGRTAGIIGLGEIGDRAAELCRSLGMRVVGTKRRLENYAGPAHAVYPSSEYRRVMAEADYLVVACSLNEETRGLINDDSISVMKRSAVLINIARGEIVDERALVRALKDGRISGAGLDTFGVPGRRGSKDLEALDMQSELWDLDNVIISPNNASASPRIYECLAEIIVENYRRLQDGLPLAHRIV